MRRFVFFKYRTIGLILLLTLFQVSSANSSEQLSLLRDGNLGVYDYCWSVILENSPWILESQISCIESFDDFEAMVSPLCGPPREQEITNAFKAFVKYSGEHSRLVDELANAYRSQDVRSIAEISVEIEKLETYWRLNPARDSVYDPLNWLSQKALSSNCQVN